MKEAAREGGSTFAPFESTTGVVAPVLVKSAGLEKGQRVLDVGCGTGVVAVTAVLSLAVVVGLDLTPALLARENDNPDVAGRSIEFFEGSRHSN